MNYVHGLDGYCVSIALRRADTIELGVVYDPTRDQLFSAQLARGALLNGRPAEVSRAERLDQALVAVSLAPRIGPESADVTRFLQTLYHCQGVRRLGSAALNLCYVATGRLDAYWATSVHAWDVAAGIRCVLEAGGMVTALDGGPVDLDRPKLVASANPLLHAELLRVLSEPDVRSQL
jgi:myo-inositol-1(or 4)-monophosphatase